MENTRHKIVALSQKVRTWQVDPASYPHFKRECIGRDSTMHRLAQELSALPPAARREAGKAFNTLKALVKAKHQAFMAGTATQQTSITMTEDLTLPPAPTLGPGSIHPLSIVIARALAILQTAGFSLIEGPDIEDERHNFTALNFPDHHPARDMQATFFLSETAGDAMALRTQTSSVQIRAMEERNPPLRIASPGRVFRRETISARSHCVFHQIEALYVDKGVTFADLHGELLRFFCALFGASTRVRLRPSYFPFTSPSAEMDVACTLCDGGCQLCKGTGWVEIGGAGMVDPQVLKNCHLSPDQYTGFAFAIGVERAAMLLMQIPDVRLFTTNDLRFLRQYTYEGRSA